MSNNNRREPPNYPQHPRYPPNQQTNNKPPIPQQYHNAPPQFYQHPPYAYQYQRPPPPPNNKQAQQMSKHGSYNPQMHYNNYYYQQPYMPPAYPHYPPPYQNNYQQYRPQTQTNYHYNPNNSNYNQAKQTTNRQSNQHRNYSPRDNKNYYHKEEPNKYQKIEKREANEDTPKKQQKHSQKSYSQNYSENDNIPLSSSDQDSEQEQVVYRRKAIVKKKDPVFDSKQQIRKWIQARKRNYPKRSMSTEQTQVKVQQSQLSILQKKIRKKILLVNSDPRSMMKKLKDIDILRRFILYSRKNKRSNLPQRQNNPQPVAISTSKDPQQVQLNTPSKIQKNQPELQVISKSSNKLVQEQNEQGTVQIPIKSDKPQKVIQQQYGRRDDLSVDVIIKHLQMKQAQDTKTLQNLMDYKSNSFYYRYQYQTLQTNLLLQNIFSQTSYILQAIRFIVKNNFFDEDKPQTK